MNSPMKRLCEYAVTYGMVHPVEYEYPDIAAPEVQHGPAHVAKLMVQKTIENQTAHVFPNERLVSPPR